MEWSSKNINIGSILSRKKVQVTFNALENLDGKINYITTSCGCSKAKRNGNTIVVIFTPGGIPLHLQSQGFYTTKKSVTVHYLDNTTDVLSFTATIKTRI